MSDTVEVAFQKFADESGGLLEIFIIDRADMPSLIERAKDGDVHAARLAKGPSGNNRAI